MENLQQAAIVFPLYQAAFGIPAVLTSYIAQLYANQGLEHAGMWWSIVRPIA